ncbi:hypothetical protein ABH37_01915 [Mycobacterium haemophilum]|uniref:Uncharacterized protein n=1 Tax=Mycobacterium haemophilum TaxID=29311 RepID=A0A0I9VIN9_9MYCO|nr:hypothetical protein ABH39_17195 [Mycobacterium haemophilum]KLO38403.1 hypothetical protein ABH38_03025 [Mycobacterium haemophilum]KLO44737.1 hypothetical protein ABH37_01915 [Mycobacterium haemophilum]KLO56080.1 hypothetical protein ABH36_01900 [Mycobacterium haemophilum]
MCRRLRTPANGGYVRNLEDKRGKPGRWVIGDPLPESVDLLPDQAQLAPTDYGVYLCLTERGHQQLIHLRAIRRDFDQN